MGWFRKTSDPIAARERELNQRLAELQGEIRRLEQARVDGPPSTPPDANLNPKVAREKATGSPAPREPIFEAVDSLKAPAEAPADLYNEEGVRKLDLAGWWQRLQQRVRPAAPANPKLVNYLAAGSIQGLRPLRYEKRVARNQVLLLLVVLVVAALAVFGLFLRSR